MHGLPGRSANSGIFGGQIAEGRGIVEIIDAAKLAAAARPDLYFLLIGRGRLEGLVQAYIDGGGNNLALRPSIPREDYLSLVSACDVGMVCTVEGVDVPTFPSKTIDYLRAGVPVAASVERSTDFGRFVVERGFGVAVEAGNPVRLLAAISKIVDDPDAATAMRLAGRKTLDEVFNVRRAVELLLEQTLGSRGAV